MTTDLRGLPDTLGRYRLLRLLGHGGMGRVVAAEDPVLRREVAVKVVEVSKIPPDDLDEVRFLFHREARAIAALRHPNVLEVFDYSGPDAEVPFIACELVEGSNLREVLDARGRLSVEQAVAVAYEVVGGLGHAHARQIVHRDVKPENIFWTPEGRVVLGDFGIAKAFGGADNLGNTVKFGNTNLYGSPAYLAPEQLKGSEVGAHTDLYALGAVLYECLSGASAFEGATVGALLDAVASGLHKPLGEVAQVPEPLAELVEQLLQVDPGARPAQAGEVGERLRAVLDELYVTDPRLLLRQTDEPGEAITGKLAAPTGRQRSATGNQQENVVAGGESTGSVLPRPSFAERAPILLSVAALVVALVAGLLLVQRFVGAETTAPPSTVETTAAVVKDVSVLLRIDGTTRLVLDGSEIGTWSEDLRIALPAGRHRIQADTPGGQIDRQVMLLPGTSPEFSLRPP